MSEEEKRDAFLSSFKRLEAFLVRRTRGADGFSSFAQALGEAHSRKLIPGVLDGATYDFLRSAGELRNLLSHNDALCTPDASFLARFFSVVDHLLHPVRCLDVATPYAKMVKAQMGDPVGPLLSTMRDEGISHVPVVSSGRWVGVFSVSTLWEKALAGGFTYSLKLPISSFSPYLREHQNERFLFVRPDVSAHEVKGLWKKKKPRERRAAVVFLTADGTPRGKLVGLLTEADLLQVDA